MHTLHDEYGDTTVIQADHSSSSSGAALLREAREQLEKLHAVRDVQWRHDPDWRRDGADQVLDERDHTVCFLATGISRELHSGRAEFIAAAPRLVRDLLARIAQVERERDKLREMWEVEREDANQWLREEGIERKRAEAAEASLASVTAEREALKALTYLDPKKQGRTWKDAFTAANDSLQRVHQRLEPYLQHKDDCSVALHHGHWASDCTCGLADLRQGEGA